MSVHICVVSACVLSDWWRVRLEVKVEGHYLQPEELLLLPPFLPAHFLPLTWPRGQLKESFLRCSVKCVVAAGVHVHTHPWPWARNSLEDTLTHGTSHPNVKVWVWNVVELFSPASCALHPLHFISKADFILFTLLHLSVSWWLDCTDSAGSDLTFAPPAVILCLPASPQTQHRCGHVALIWFILVCYELLFSTRLVPVKLLNLFHIAAVQNCTSSISCDLICFATNVRQVESLTPAMWLISLGTNRNVWFDSFLIL